MTDLSSVRGVDSATAVLMGGESAKAQIPTGSVPTTALSGTQGAISPAQTQKSSLGFLKDPEVVKQLADGMNSALASLPNHVSFRLDEGSRPIIQVVDRDGNVVRSVPPAELLKMAQKLHEFQEAIGLVVDHAQ